MNTKTPHEILIGDMLTGIPVPLIDETNCTSTTYFTATWSTTVSLNDLNAGLGSNFARQKKPIGGGL